MQARRLLDKALRNPAGMRFAELSRLAGALGFGLSRVAGSHHIYVHPDVPELLNIQNVLVFPQLMF